MDLILKSRTYIKQLKYNNAKGIGVARSNPLLVITNFVTIIRQTVPLFHTTSNKSDIFV